MNAKTSPSRRSTRRTILFAAAGLALVPLSEACSKFVQQLHVVSITDNNGFQPASISVLVGDTVRWKNYGIYRHTVTDDPSASGAGQSSLPSGAQALNSGDILPGRTWSYTFNVPGQYQYVSTDDQGPPFQGTITVS